MTMIRAAMTQTKNAYADMPDSVDGLDGMADRLDDVRQANLDHHADLIREAAEHGAKLVGLGELFPGPYFALEKRDVWLGMAEDGVDGPTVRFMSALANELGVVIVAPFYEKRGDARYNAAAVIDADGSVQGTFRKLHIPAGANETASFVETHYYRRGDIEPHFPVFETAVGRVGVAICYDRHFEGVMRSLARNGAQIVMCPAVTFGDKSRRMWEIEFEVDASRHNLYIGGSNKLGAEPPWNIEYFGASHFVGPNGRLEDLSKNENLVISDLDVARLDASDGSGWDLARDFRSDIYQA